MRALIAAAVLASLLAADPAPARPRGAPAQAVPVASLSSGDFRDLAPLRRRLEGVRIVQLGESSHGAAEFNRVKTRLVRFLHEEMGFDVLAFESDPYQCALADRAAATASPKATLGNCVVGVWHTEEVAELFAYLRETRKTRHPLMLAGYDIQPIGPNKDGRPDYIATVVARLDPKRAQAARALDRAFLDAYAKPPPERRRFFREHRADLIARFTDLHRFLVDNEKALLDAFAGSNDPQAPLLAQQTVWTTRQYLIQQTAPSNLIYAEARDWGMAQNLIFLAERLKPRSKIITWAHNAHVQHGQERIDLTGIEEPAFASRAAGTWLRERYGSRLFTMGIYASAGRMTRNDRREIEVSPVRPGSLEARPFPGGAVGTLFLAPTDGSRDPLWTRTITAKYWGAADVPMILSEQYNGVLLLRTVTPPRYLD